MIEVTEAAQKQLADFFIDRDVKPVRVFLNESGWGGPSMAMALDELKNNDQTFEIGGFQYVVDKDFLEKANPIKVDFSPVGFSITSSIDLTSACKSCSTTGSCC